MVPVAGVPSSSDVTHSSSSPSYSSGYRSAERRIGPGRGRVESVDRQRKILPARLDPPGGGRAQAQGGMHRCAERDCLGPRDQLVVPRFHCQVECSHVMTRGPEASRRRGQMDRLAPEFVGGDQGNAHLVPPFGMPLSYVALSCGYARRLYDDRIRPPTDRDRGLGHGYLPGGYRLPFGHG